MSVLVIACGDAVNHSEELAIERCRLALEGLGKAEKWIVLSNLSFSASPLRQSDDLDLVCIGQRGVVLIEVKHWDSAWVKENPLRADAEADKLTAKARRVGGQVRKILSGTNVRVPQWLLFTRETPAIPKLEQIRGVPVATLKSLGERFKQLSLGALTPQQVDLVAQALEPRTRIQVDGGIRRLGDYENLELFSPREDRFHRAYRGVHRRTKEKVILHLYDISASNEKDARRLAEREFRALQILQKSRSVPRFRDSLQDLPDYPGELSFFTVFDPEAPSVERRVGDKTFTVEQRIEFAAQAADALKEIHGLTDEQSVSVIHRNLAPETVLVAARNRPLFTGFQLARLPLTQTLSTKSHTVSPNEWVAPEVVSGGLSAATAESDVFSLCATLRFLFKSAKDPIALSADGVLEAGCATGSGDRPSLEELSGRLREVLLPRVGELDLQVVEPSYPPAEFWSEGVEVPFRTLVVRIVARLGSGGIGRTFKVEHVDPLSGENYGTYVAKVIGTPEAGEAARRAYNRVRSHSVTPGLSTVFDVADRWEPNRVVALLRWLDGESLDGLRGVLSVAAEDYGEESVQTLLRRWLREICTALTALHENNLIHGDVSPRNVIHYRGGLTLTDFDLVTQVGQEPWCSGAKAYCSPEAERREAVFPSDDIFALAASLFEAAFDRSPFLQKDGSLDKGRGLSWREAERELIPRLLDFFERATHSDRSQRFADARAVLAWLDSTAPPTAVITSAPAISESTVASLSPDAEASPSARTEQIIPWLSSLLRVYPGSPHGNVETRGLDSEFAVATYVPTALESELYREIEARHVRLVVLCGNAGDGKTALLQRLAASFGVDRLRSETRIWETRTGDGLTLKANLDGSAAWQGRSANELLDDFFEPFLDGAPTDDRAHLLAINDGRLLEWLENRVRTVGESALTRSLSSFLATNDEARPTPSHVRFISLNQRSLVGAREQDQRVTTDFLDQLIVALLGGAAAADKWQPCLTCTAWDRCTAGPTAHRLLAPKGTPEWLRAERLRRGLAETLQAVHQRGNVHITTRELRGTLSYILFGVFFCQELHDHPDWKAPLPGDMAFDPSSPFRQGELLRELAELDPGLEAHPHLDRWLTGRSTRDLAGAGPSYPSLPVESSRRRAYFEWTTEEIEKVAGAPDALGLATGEHLKQFRLASLREAGQNAELCAEICRGISNKEDLPLPAFRHAGMVALRIPSRTPTETAFWVEKPLDRFRLEPELHASSDVSLPVLPRRLRVIYRFIDGREETLVLGYSLFHTLLNLAGGEQLSELRSDDLFANLQIFTQRIAQEDEAHLLSWHPKADESVFRIGIRRGEDRQILACDMATN